MKGLKALISSGSVQNDPAGIAAFLMEHSALLDKTQLGELFGHHEDREVTGVPCLSAAAGSASSTAVVQGACLHNMVCHQHGRAVDTPLCRMSASSLAFSVDTPANLLISS